MRVISIDPGLDLVALAVFEYDGSRKWAAASVDAKMGALDGVRRVSTKPTDPMPYRLCSLHVQLDVMLATQSRTNATHIYVEMPAVAGAYQRAGRGGKNLYAGDTDRFHMALGVILAACEAQLEDGNPTHLYRASTKLKKAARLAFTRELVAKYRPELGKVGADSLDAIYAGLVQPWPTL